MINSKKSSKTTKIKPKGSKNEAPAHIGEGWPYLHELDCRWLVTCQPAARF